MGGSLFHFRVSEPLGEGLDTRSYEYDPDNQIGAWTGSASAVALHCTWQWVGRENCTAYGTYCGSDGFDGHYVCDT